MMISFRALPAYHKKCTRIADISVTASYPRQRKEKKMKENEKMEKKWKKETIKPPLTGSTDRHPDSREWKERTSA